MVQNLFLDYNREPIRIIAGHKPVADFIYDRSMENASEEVIASFGDEWEKFDSFKDKDLQKLGQMYFDILPCDLLNEKSRILDVGCGTGRWSKYLVDKVGTIDLIDPSKAIFVADRMLKDKSNIRLARASADAIPFADNQFDMVMSIGVLHHIPDTLRAMKDCVQKVKPGGYFYVYLYYSLDNRGFLFKSIFRLSNLVRKMISSFPQALKKIACDILAVLLYMPFVGLSRFFYAIGLKRLSAKIPLSSYRDKSFHIIRNDSLDRFGTKLEQRFSRKQILSMMEESGLSDVRFSPNSPYWHAIGKKI